MSENNNNKKEWVIMEYRQAGENAGTWFEATVPLSFKDATRYMRQFNKASEKHGIYTMRDIKKIEND